MWTVAGNTQSGIALACATFRPFAVAILNVLPGCVQRSAAPEMAWVRKTVEE